MARRGVQRLGNAGATGGATPGATPGQRPGNEGATLSLIPYGVAPAPEGGVHAPDGPHNVRQSASGRGADASHLPPPASASPAPLAAPPPDRSEALLASARAAWGATLHHGRLGCEHLLAAAAALTEALAVLPAEEAADWLAAAGLPLAGVRNLLELHRVALDACALDALGGVPLAVAWAAEARLPRTGEALAVTLGGWHPDRAVPVAFVWPSPEAPGAFHAGRIDLAGPPEDDRVTRAPLAQERDLWATVWHLLGHRHADMVFRPLRAEAPRLVARLEARRRAAAEGSPRRVH